MVVSEGERGFLVRPAEEGDIAAMADVQLRTVLTAYADIFPPEAPPPTFDEYVGSWRTSLARQEDGAAAFVAEAWNGRHDGTVIGIVLADPMPDVVPGPSKHGNVRALYVDPEHWQRGVGRRLHDAAREYLRVARPQLHTLSLWVLERNPRARGRYENWGWLPTADRQEIWPGVHELRYEAKQ
jgi:GNAT superfamily N-acetyltransferase